MFKRDFVGSSCLEGAVGQGGLFRINCLGVIVLGILSGQLLVEELPSRECPDTVSMITHDNNQILKDKYIGVYIYDT